MQKTLSMWAMLLGCVGMTNARAEPILSLPEVSESSIPYVHYGGMAPAEGSVVLFTVDEGKEIIITLASADPGLTLKSGSTVLVPAWMTQSGPSNSVAGGRAHVRVTAGTTVSMHNDRGMAIGYYIQGYHVVPGSPYRAFTAKCPEACTSPDHTVFTADAERPFLLQTTAVGGSCDVYIDDTLTIPYTSQAAWFGYPNRGMVKGLATLVVPAGSSLKLSPGSCDYYFDGKYLTP